MRASSKEIGPAFITGGSSGIGLALAHRLLMRGHDLALIARDIPRLEDARSRLAVEFPQRRVELIPTDVSDSTACLTAATRAVDVLGPPAWIIANAGVAIPGEFLQQRVVDHEQQMATNYLGALYFSHALAPHMKSRGGGHLVFVASGAAMFGIYGYSAYAPSKFAMRGLAEVLRVELAQYGICVTLAMPPDTDTPQYAAENLTKPGVTKAITAGGGLWKAEAVAERIIAGALRKRFVVAPGLQLTALASVNSMLAPVLRRYQVAVARRLATRPD